MLNIFKKRPQPRIVSVRTTPNAAPLPANIDMPAFLRRTPMQEAEIEAMRQRAKENAKPGYSVMPRLRGKNGRFTKSQNGIPVWVAVIGAAVLCFATHACTYSTRPTIEVERVKYVDRTYTIEYQTVVHETFPVPVCMGMPTKPSKHKIKQINTLAAVIPASALGRYQ